jgi:hypothetical protein
MSLRPATVAAVDAAAARRGWARSQIVDLVLSGADCLDALQVIADVGLEAYHAAHAREKAPNATETIAASSTEGHARLRAFDKIAAGNRK